MDFRQLETRGKRVVLLGTIAAASALLMAAPAQAQPGPIPTDPHFQCYSVSGGTQPAQDDRVVRDQFGQKLVDIDEPRRLCAPALKGEPGETTATATTSVDFDGPHLVCYDIDGGHVQNEVFDVFNQFDTGRPNDEVTVLGAEELCVPSGKLLTPGTSPGIGELVHFQCYRLSGGLQPDQDDRFVQDQFGQKVVDVDEPRRLCNPALKGEPGETTLPPPDFGVPHPVFYDIDEGRQVDRRVFVFNQFTGATGQRITVRTAQELALPSLKVG